MGLGFSPSFAISRTSSDSARTVVERLDHVGALGGGSPAGFRELCCAIEIANGA
jgi:hypothetical protein